MEVLFHGDRKDMKLPERLFSRMMLAYLPLMIYAPDMRKVCLAAFCTVLVFWATVFFFWFMRRFFPERFLKEAFFFWLLAWGQAGWYEFKLEPAWLLSVFFLTPATFLDSEHKASRVRVFSKLLPRYFWERILTGFGFAGFAIVMSAVQEMLVKRFGVLAFEQPSGVFLLLASAAFLWKNQNFNDASKLPSVSAERKPSHLASRKKG